MSDVFQFIHHAAHQPLQAELQSTVQDALLAFPTVRLLHLVRTNTLSLAHYHELLISLYHVAHLTPHCHARAAINCGALQSDAQLYLQRRASAARDHSQLILNDLKNTQYPGPDIRAQSPPDCAQPLIGLLSFVSHEAPVCMLAIICVLDAINFTHRSCFHRMQRTLHLPGTATRYLSATSALAGEQRCAVWASIASAQPSADAQRWMTTAAESAGRFYYGLFDGAGTEAEQA